MTFNLFRLNELTNQDSSGYWRLIAPLVFFEGNLVELVSGFPFGSMEQNIENYFMFDGDKWHGTGIDNGIYVFIYYFGLLALAFFLYLFSLFIKTKDTLIKNYIVFYVLLLNASGAIFSIDFIFLTVVFPLFAYKLKVKNMRFRYAHN